MKKERIFFTKNVGMSCAEKKQTTTTETKTLHDQYEDKQNEDPIIDFSQLMFIKHAPLQSLPTLQYFLEAFCCSNQNKINK